MLLSPRSWLISIPWWLLSWVLPWWFDLLGSGRCPFSLTSPCHSAQWRWISHHQIKCWSVGTSSLNGWSAAHVRGSSGIGQCRLPWSSFSWRGFSPGRVCCWRGSWCLLQWRRLLFPSADGFGWRASSFDIGDDGVSLLWRPGWHLRSGRPLAWGPSTMPTLKDNSPSLVDLMSLMAVLSVPGNAPLFSLVPT